MNYRILGRTGLKVSEIGLGTWALGSGIYGKVDKNAAVQLVKDSIDKGINFFDTAPLYGTKNEDGVSEKLLGAALGSGHDSILISTKFGRTSTQVTPGRFFAKEARQSCEASLSRLGREAIDLLFFHSPFTPEEIHEDVWAELSRLKDHGKIRFIGHSVSLFQDTAEMSSKWMRAGLVDVIQVVLSPFNREARPLIDTAIACDCGVVARECLANGFLSGAIREDTVFPQGSLNARYTRQEISERVAYADKLSSVMVGGGIQTLAQAAYRWLLDQPGVSMALSGAKNRQELQDPVKASLCAPLDSTTLESVEKIHDKDFVAA